ncbi:uncharacterized protein [Venturia canescens]|nr:uncharacterized protein LOC122414199 isoform X2 [Venturia canescens]
MKDPLASLKSIEKEMENLKKDAQNNLTSIINELDDLCEGKLKDMWDDLNQKRRAFYQLKTKTSNENSNCSLLLTNLGHSVTEVERNLMDCVNEQSEKGKRYFEYIENVISTVLRRLEDSKTAAGRCSSGDNIERFNTYLLNGMKVPKILWPELSSSISQFKDFRRSLPAYLTSCTFVKNEAYRLDLSTYVDARCPVGIPDVQ